MASWKITAVLLGGLIPAVFILQAQEELTPEDIIEHSNCIYFGPQHDKLASGGNGSPLSSGPKSNVRSLSLLTNEVTAQLADTSATPGGSRTGSLQQLDQLGTIDRYLFQAMNDAGVAPADLTTDFEFLRRLTLDLTGRIPTPDAVTSFVNDASPDKRAKLVQSLLAKPEWVDKWSSFYGDLFQNNSRNSQIPRYAEGVLAFQAYIRDALTNNKPYDQMAREMISSSSANSYTTGQINFIVGGVVTGGPTQDIYDQQTVNTVQTFLGIAHMNCLLCHNGRGHLDALSLWGANTTRYQGWQMASFLSHTDTGRTPVSAANPLPYYWSVGTNPKRSDYQLNTTTGNRPARQPSDPKQTTVAPVYLFSGRSPNPGEDYRVAFAREITSDFQFSRASVNYLWKEFFGVGLVDPVNQFDPARLDPDNPPPAPWALQPSNPRLLNALAQEFIASGYNVKAMMAEIANSRAYQLSSRYNSNWSPAWTTLFARKMVRRLWAEEIHDAVAQSSNIVPSYAVGVYGKISWAMQFPEPLGTPDGTNGRVAMFLDSFLRGNRDDEQRDGEGSVSQALNLMNDPLIMSRISSTGPSTSLLPKLIALPDDQLVSTLFLTVLSRYPTDYEKTTALANLKSGSSRNQEAENLLWSLYNKVDFIYNY